MKRRTVEVAQLVSIALIVQRPCDAKHCDKKQRAPMK